MDITEGETIGGREYIRFKTRYNELVSIIVQEEGQLRISFRDGDTDDSIVAPFTHLYLDQVAALLPYLQGFVATGELRKEEE